MKIPKKIISIILGTTITPSSFTATVFLSTFETLEGKYKNLILPKDADEDKWSILKNKLTSSNDESLNYRFKQIKNIHNSQNEELKKLCFSSLNFIYKSALHLNSTYEKNVENFCTLKIKDTFNSDLVTKEKSWNKKINSIEKLEDNNQKISPSLKLLKAKLKASTNKKENIVKEWCTKIYQMPYGSLSSKTIAKEAEKYCSFRKKEK